MGFKLKNDKRANILQNNIRRVLHSYKEKEYMNYFDTFAIVVKPIFCKSLFTIGVKRRLRIRYKDVVTKFF